MNDQQLSDLQERFMSGHRLPQTTPALIAAAPALLEACKMQREWLIAVGGFSEAIEEQIDPVINQAEGKI